MIALRSSELLFGVFARGGQHQDSMLTGAIGPCRCVNNYGPFAVMTRARYEIVIEGSSDRRTWEEYDFKYKPGDIRRGPTWIIPHQPRVDWQMWFAALGEAGGNPWFGNLLWRMLSGSERVAGLFRINPFPDAPPRWLRAKYYQYHFSTPAERAHSGQWWTRELAGEYYPAVEADDFRPRRSPP